MTAITKAAGLCYRPAVFFHQLRSISLSFLQGKIRHGFQKYYINLLFYFTIRKLENAYVMTCLRLSARGHIPEDNDVSYLAPSEMRVSSVFKSVAKSLLIIHLPQQAGTISTPGQFSSSFLTETCRPNPEKH